MENTDTTDFFDSVIVDSATLFAAGDIAMFYQVKGLEIYPPGHPDEGKVNRGVGNPNTGIYTLIRVYDVDIPGNAVIFSTYLPKMKAPKPGEVNQLIKVHMEDHFSTSKTIICEPWDSAAGTGGVVAIIAGSKITLNGDIDVSGKGFIGGETTLFGGDCSKVTGSFHFENDRDSSGRKGEGAVLSNYGYARGRQLLANAGGGGNGKFSGGGGGGNRGGGGLGGYPSNACGNNDPFNLAIGGYIGADLYTNVTELKNRIYFGGGGGAGNEGEGRTGTPGGNGGGIIILVTDTLESQNASLLAAGESVTDIATAGAGGGGGGGVIVIDANVITGNLALDVSGGDGGHTNYATDRSGPGGLGGAGVIWHSGLSLPGGITTDYTEGNQGFWNLTSNHGTSNTGGGDDGVVLNNLIIPLRGFTFNVASGTQTICQGDTPDTIIASTPKGDVSFTYEWLSSQTKSSGYAPAPGINNQKDYAPGPLFDTTYYKRVVTPTDTLNRDTSGVVSIFVHDTITNNFLSQDDIICWNIQPDTMTGTDPVGGDHLSYYYLWENRTGSGGWTSSQGDSLAEYRYPAGLQETTYFRRKVTSGACTHYSDSLTIEVLDTIGGNHITDQQRICQYTAADSLFGGALSGGDNTYAYSWQLSYDYQSWVELGTDMNFDPGLLDTATNHIYVRIARSGGPAQDACVDTSNFIAIQVHPEISNNLLEPLDTLVCEGTDPGTIRPALAIGGGDGLAYAYYWEESLDQAAWTPLAGDTVAAHAPAPLSDTTWFRRIVKSGECRDTSSAALINVHPGILNNLVTDHDTVCYNTQPLPFTQDGSPVSGGIGIYAYHWKSRTGQSGWEDASGVNDQSGYQAPALTDTTYFSRVVGSGVCLDTSNLLAVVVQDDIQNNIINGDLPVSEACENIGDTITGTGSMVLSGGDEAGYAFLWEKFNTGSQQWQDAPVDNSGNTDSTYITEDMTVMSYYRRQVWSGACHDVTDSVTLNVNPRPTITLLPFDHLVECYDGNNPVMFNIPVQLTGTPPYVVHYNKVENDSAGVSVASGGSFTVPLYAEDITDYTITITDLIDNNICFSYPADLPAATPTARISRKPEPLMLLAADSVCGPILTVTARDPISSTASGWWSSADQGFTFEDSTSSETEMSTTFPEGQDRTETILRWTELNGNCPPVSRDTLVVLFEEPHAAAVRSEDTILYFAPNTRLWAVPTGVGQGTWTHVSGSAQMDDDDKHNPNVYVSFGDTDLDKEDFNEFRWTVQNVKCPATTADVRIERKDIAQYSAFSPNYDDINDYFILDGLEYADEFTMHILTRQGVTVYTISKSPGVDFTWDMWWDGRLDGGDEAADGTYFYVLKVKYAGQTYEYKGYVELVRPIQ